MVLLILLCRQRLFHSFSQIFNSSRRYILLVRFAARILGMLLMGHHPKVWDVLQLFFERCGRSTILGDRIFIYLRPDRQLLCEPTNGMLPVADDFRFSCPHGRR